MSGYPFGLGERISTAITFGGGASGMGLGGAGFGWVRGDIKSRV